MAGHLCVAEDVTEREAVHRAVVQALEHERSAVERLRELERVKADFVATVSHELRTPLTSMIGYLELLDDGAVGELTSDQRQLATRVQRNGRRLLLLVEDLLLLDALHDRIVIGSMNRGGLAGSAWELDDRFTAYDAESVESMGLDGGKMLIRFDYADPGTIATIASAAAAVTALARRRLVALVEVLPAMPEAPGVATGAFGIVVMIEDSPHPNAAKLFANWMAMREGQETWGRTDQIPVVRTDVDNSWAPPYTIPQPGIQYLDGYDWNYVNTAFPESMPKIRQMMALRQ